MNFLKTIAAAATLAFAMVGGASAATIQDTLPEFNYDGPDDMNSPVQSVGTFSFALPGSPVSATVSGTFGNSVVSNSAGVELYGDGVFLGECVYQTACWSSSTPTAFSFAVANLGDLLDGAFELTIIQTSEFITRLGQTTLTVETVPVPASLPLLLAGLGGLAALRRRKKS